MTTSEKPLPADAPVADIDPTAQPSPTSHDGGPVPADYAALLSAAGQFFSVTQAEPRRLLHGRGHRYPGLEHLNVDWYPPVLLLTFYGEPDGITSLLDQLLALDQLGQIRTVALQRRQRQGAEATVLWGEQLMPRVVSEAGLRFEVRPGQNRNAGLFLDMAPLREWLQRHSEGRNVLNLFAYTCSLSVAALAGGARQVVSVDMSKPAIQWGQRNHQLNHQDLSRVRALPHNLFTSWGRISQLGRYDTLIIDPPTRQRGSFDVEKNYATVIRRIPKLASTGAEVIATINSPFHGPGYLIEQFEKHAPQVRFREFMPIPDEFLDLYPEKGLNIGRFTVGGE